MFCAKAEPVYALITARAVMMAAEALIKRLATLIPRSCPAKNPLVNTGRLNAPVARSVVIAMVSF